MIEDQFRAALEALQTGLQSELNRQIAVLQGQQGQVISELRREVETEVERRWRAKLEALRSEWSARLESERAAADTEAARRTLAERERLTAELDGERQTREALASELERSHAALLEQQAVARTAMQQSSTLAAAQASERQARLIEVDRLLGAVSTISAASSLSDTLAALLTSVGREVPRAAVFLVNGAHLQMWKGTGFTVAHETLQLEADAPDVVRRAFAGCSPVATSDAPPPGFATLAPDRAGLAVPLMVGGKPVAVLYADDGTLEPHPAPAAWPEAVQLLALHASERLAHLTAVRTAQAMRYVSPGRQDPSIASRGDDAGAAQRYARLLVSEIKLYNEAAVRQGRENRDLFERLGTEIERARQLYEDRVPATLGGRKQYFEHELVQTLAGGDPALLGVRA